MAAAKSVSQNLTMAAAEHEVAVTEEPVDYVKAVDDIVNAIDPKLRSDHAAFFDSVGPLAAELATFTGRLEKVTKDARCRAHHAAQIAQRFSVIVSSSDVIKEETFEDMRRATADNADAARSKNAVKQLASVFYDGIFRHPAAEKYRMAKAKITELQQQITELQQQVPKRRSEGDKVVKIANHLASMFRSTVIPHFQNLPNQKPLLTSAKTSLSVIDRNDDLVPASVIPTLIIDANPAESRYELTPVTPEALDAEQLEAIKRTLLELIDPAVEAPWRIITKGNTPRWALRLRLILLGKDGTVIWKKQHDLSYKDSYGPSFGFGAETPEMSKAYYVYACSKQLNDFVADPTKPGRDPPALIMVPAEFATGPISIGSDVYAPKMIITSYAFKQKRLGITTTKMMFGNQIRESVVDKNPAVAAVVPAAEERVPAETPQGSPSHRNTPGAPRGRKIKRKLAFDSAEEEHFPPESPLVLGGKKMRR